MSNHSTEQEGNQGQYQEESGYSNEVMIESLPISPDNLYATLANNTIHLQWTVSNACHVEL